MTIQDNIKLICKNKKIPVYKIEEDLGFAKGYISKLHKSTPGVDRLQKIAEYLNVSLADLTGENTSFPVLSCRDQKDISKDLNNIREKLLNGLDGPASYDGEELSPEAAELFLDEIEIALKRLKIINKEKYNPNKNKNKD